MALMTPPGTDPYGEPTKVTVISADRRRFTDAYGLDC
jgi:hypothetical protein